MLAAVGHELVLNQGRSSAARCAGAPAQWRSKAQAALRAGAQQ